MERINSLAENREKQRERVPTNSITGNTSLDQFQYEDVIDVWQFGHIHCLNYILLASIF